MTFVNRSSDLQLPVSDDATLPRAETLAAVKSFEECLPLPSEIVAREVFSDLDVSVTDEDRAFWCMMKPRARPSFTVPLLKDLGQMQALIRRLFGEVAPSEARPFDYFVLGSNSPGVFNLGGDLQLFVEKIRNGEREALRRYGHACSEAGFANYQGYGHGIITIGLIEGDALGGGWESASSCDVLVAERRARFGLPEILFNLFPGMGAYSFLSRRIGPMKAEELIMSGKIYTAEEMHAIGVVDVLAENGQGRTAVRGYIAANRGKRNAHSAIYKVRRRVNPVSLEELRDIVDIWVDAAMNLSEQDMRKMLRIAAAQDRFRDRVASAGAQ